MIDLLLIHILFIILKFLEFRFNFQIIIIIFLFFQNL